MQKRRYGIFTAVLLLIFLICSAFPAKAENMLLSEKPLVVDGAGLLTVEELEALTEKVSEISKRQALDVVIVTAATLDGMDSASYADDFYDENGYGQGAEADGVLLLLDMEERTYYISTCGFGITALTDYGIEQMAEQFVPYLSEGLYYEAFVTFAELVDAYVTEAKDGTPVDYFYEDPDEEYTEEWEYIPYTPARTKPGVGAFLGCGLAGTLVSFLVTGSMQRKMQSVGKQRNANSYYRNGSMRVTVARDAFLYRNVTRTPRQTAEDRNDMHSGGGHMGGSSVHVSSSGHTHGGGGGHF